eukprot:9137317-Pyramimonas_sp.AAC.1
MVSKGREKVRLYQPKEFSETHTPQPTLRREPQTTRLVPATGIFYLPFRDWCPLWVCSISPSTIGARYGYIGWHSSIHSLFRRTDRNPSVSLLWQRHMIGCLCHVIRCQRLNQRTMRTRGLTFSFLYLST